MCPTVPAAVAAVLLGVALVTAQQVVRHKRAHTSSTSRSRAVSAVPAAYNISNVPWQQQVTDFDCGAAASQMVLQYWAQSPAEYDALNQADVMDVARTTDSSGTWTTDILRVGRFSALSTPPLRWYAANSTCPGGGDGVCHGFAHRPVGAAAYDRMSDAFWLADLKGVIAADHPVVVLMNWDATAVRDGHYRVVVGYDDALQRVYFNDPWGRDQAPVQAFSYQNFSIAWNYTEHGHAGGWKPYWAALFAPWTVAVDLKPLQPLQPLRPAAKGQPDVQWCDITATITYPLFPAFPVDAEAHTAVNTIASVALSDALLLDDSQRAAVRLGDAKPGTAFTVRWRAFVNATAAARDGDGWAAEQWIRVSASGITRSAADRIYCCGGAADGRAARVARTRTPLQADASGAAEAAPRAVAFDFDAFDSDRDASGATAAASGSAAAEYYFPAYDYADAIGGGVTQSLSDLLRRP